MLLHISCSSGVGTLKWFCSKIHPDLLCKKANMGEKSAQIALIRPENKYKTAHKSYS
jgi:hypothetical protein